MIIKYPTGYYKEVLPSSPSDGGNITYTISNTEPPRSNLSFQRIPNGVKSKQASNKIHDRSNYGQLAISYSTATATDLNDNSSNYQIGQVIEFNEFSDRSINPLLITDNIEERHDLLVFDYTSLGLDINDEKVIANSSINKLNQYKQLLNDTLKQRKNAEVLIASSQKRINDIDRNLDALSLLDQSDDIVAIINKLRSSKIEYENQRALAQNAANEAASQATIYRNNIRTLSSVVK